MRPAFWISSGLIVHITLANGEYNKLLEQASSQTGQARFDTLVKAAKILNQDQAIAPLYQPALATLLKKDVHHLIYDPVGGYTFRDVTLK